MVSEAIGKLQEATDKRQETATKLWEALLKTEWRYMDATDSETDAE